MLRRYDVGVCIGMVGVMAGYVLLRQEWANGWWTLPLYLGLWLVLYLVGFLIQKDMPDMPDCHYFIRHDKQVRLCTNQSEIGPEYQEISWLKYFWYGLEFYAEGLFGGEED